MSKAVVKAVVNQSGGLDGLGLLGVYEDEGEDQFHGRTYYSGMGELTKGAM